MNVWDYGEKIEHSVKERINIEKAEVLNANGNNNTRDKLNRKNNQDTESEKS